MSFKNIQKSKNLLPEYFSFLYGKLKRNPSILNFKQISEKKYWVCIDSIILGEKTESEIVLYSKYRDMPEDLRVLLDHLVLGKELPPNLPSVVNKESKSKNQKTNKKNFGEISRVSGRIFETLFFKDLKNRGSYFKSFIAKFLHDNSLNFNPEDLLIDIEDTGRKTYDSVSGHKTPAKADLVLKITFPNSETREVGLSLKKTCNRTQVSINSVDSFLENLSVQTKVSVPDSIRCCLKKFCGVEGFTPSFLEPKRIVEQQRRDRYLIKELSEKEQKELLSWCEENKKEILEIALFRGGVKKGPSADYLISTKTPYVQGDISLPELIIESKADIIKEANKTSVYQGRDSGTVNIGAGVSFQMKGSGKNRKLKTMLQFQKSPSKAS